MKIITISIFVLFKCFFVIGQDNFTIIVNDTMKSKVRIEKDNITGTKTLFHVIVNCDTLNEYNVYTYDFQIQNNNDTSLYFMRVCWGEPFFCPSYSNDTIKKGQIKLLRYRCMTQFHPGAFSKTANVRTNLGDFNITFKGRIIPK